MVEGHGWTFIFPLVPDHGIIHIYINILYNTCFSINVSGYFKSSACFRHRFDAAHPAREENQEIAVAAAVNAGSLQSMCVNQKWGIIGIDEASITCSQNILFGIGIGIYEFIFFFTNRYTDTIWWFIWFWFSHYSSSMSGSHHAAWNGFWCTLLLPMIVFQKSD